MTSVVDRERGGATSVQMALLWTGMLALVLASVQTALFFYAGQVALTAAEDGLRSGRYYKAEPVDEARRETEAFLARVAGKTLTSTSVDVTVDPDAPTLQVTVSGDVLSIVPGVMLRVSRQATGAVEQVTQ
jgi:Flp pilus assembly protein TadG